MSYGSAVVWKRVLSYSTSWAALKMAKLRVGRVLVGGGMLAKTSVLIHQQLLHVPLPYAMFHVQSHTRTGTFSLQQPTGGYHSRFPIISAASV